MHRQCVPGAFPLRAPGYEANQPEAPQWLLPLLTNLGSLCLHGPILLFVSVLILLEVSFDCLNKGQKRGIKQPQSFSVIPTLRSSSVSRDGGRGLQSNWQNLSIVLGLRYSNLPWKDHTMNPVSICAIDLGRGSNTTPPHEQETFAYNLLGPIADGRYNISPCGVPSNVSNLGVFLAVHECHVIGINEVQHTIHAGQQKENHTSAKKKTTTSSYYVLI